MTDETRAGDRHPMGDDDGGATRAAGRGGAVPVAPDPQEEALLARLRAGDEDAFAVVIRTYGPRLLGLARRLVGHEEDARDVLQEALTSAFRSIGRFEGQARLGTWLHRIVVNRALMTLRTRRRHPEHPIDDLLPAFEQDGHHRGGVETWTDPERALERHETRDLVRGLLARLPDSYREVIVLRDLEELDTAETARALGTSENAVKIRLHRARLALRTLLDAHFRGAA